MGTEALERQEPRIPSEEPRLTDEEILAIQGILLEEALKAGNELCEHSEKDRSTLIFIEGKGLRVDLSNPELERADGKLRFYSEALGETNYGTGAEEGESALAGAITGRAILEKLPGKRRVVKALLDTLFSQEEWSKHLNREHFYIREQFYGTRFLLVDTRDPEHRRMFGPLYARAVANGEVYLQEAE